MKRIFGFMLMVLVCLFNVMPLMAEVNAVKVISESHAINQVTDEGAYVTNQINLGNSDLTNGKVAIDITINNTTKTEVIYVIDNGSNVRDYKSTLIDMIKKNATNLESNNFYQGIVTTTDSSVSYVQLDNKNIANQLEALKSEDVASTNGEVFTSIDKAASSFTTTAKNKTMVIFIANLGSTDANTLKSKIDSYKSQGINIIVYGINISDSTSFETIFANASRRSITTSDISNVTFTIDNFSSSNSTMNNIATKVSFDDYILNNFTIENVVCTKGEASFDSNTNEIAWGIGNINSNETVKLSYYLVIKNNVDESLINKVNLRTNKQVIVTSSGTEIGTFPSHDKAGTEICSPQIMILAKGTTNPATGVVDFIIPAACLMAVALVTLVILNNKNEFNRI